MVHPLLGKILDLPRLCDMWLPTATESPSNRKFGTCHDFLPISQYFSLLQVQSITFFVFRGWQVCYASLIFLIFFISVHLPLWLLVICNSTYFIMLIKTLQTRSLLDLYFVYLIWNSSFVNQNYIDSCSDFSQSHYTSSGFISNEETLTCTYNGKKFFQSLKDETIYQSVSF